jgi:glutathione peroxidase
MIVFNSRLVRKINDADMKIMILLISTILITMTTTERTDSVHKYQINLINGKNISLGEFEGNVLLIVNTASECGYTPQYAGLQQLHEAYSGKGLTIIGFPANNFGRQEPGTNEDIEQFCEINYGVTFPLSAKVSVRGDDIHPLFEDLISRNNPDFTGEIGWNFEKFLIDGNGNLLRRFKSNVSPESQEIKQAIEQALS